MKIRSFRYLLGEGFKNTWVNRLMTLASIGVLVACMVVIGLADLISRNITVYLQGLQEQNVVFAFLKDENWKIFKETETPEQTATQTTESSESSDSSDSSLQSNPEAAKEGNYTVKTNADANQVREAIGNVGNVAGAYFVADTYAMDYARNYMPEAEYNCYVKLVRSGDGQLPCGVFLDLSNTAAIRDTVAAVAKVPGVAAAYTSDVQNQQGHIVAYLDDVNWALCHVKPSTEPAPAVEQSNEELPDDGYWIHNKEEALEIAQRIKGLDNVKSAEYISGEDSFDEAIQFMSAADQKYFKNWKSDEDKNPMSCAIKVSMKEMKSFDETVKQIENMSEVSNIRSHRDAAQKIAALKKGIAIAGIAIMIILIAISLMIVSNTIRITMYNRKLEISIMKAVGATNAFVRIPFIVEGILIGVFSAIFSEAVVYFCYRVATETMRESLNMVKVIPFGEVWLPLLILFLIIGVAAGTLGSAFMIGKYLRREGSEFTAI